MNKKLIPGGTYAPILTKLSRIMRLMILMFILGINSLLAASGYSQVTKITLKMTDTRVEDVLNQIESKSEFFFLFNQKQIDVNRKVSIEAKDEKISDILDDLFAGTDVKHQVIDRQIVLTATSGTETQIQGKKVTGKVTDSAGGSLPGVSIVIKGTSTGVITDANGNYSLTNISDNAILQFSFVGMKTQEIVVGGKTTFNVKLVDDAVGIEEVVAIGYGTTKKSDVVGSSSSIGPKDILKQPVARVDQVLQGRSPGIVVQNTSSAPNGSFTIRIRGNNSLNGSNDPLVVIDGFIGGDLSTINPNDISNIEVLKDASSTAIYGSRGANGVILVTTKKGASNQKVVVEFNSYLNIQSASKKIDLLNAAEFAETVNANRTDLKLNKPFTDAQIADFKANGGTDWQDIIFRKALQQSHQISITGGGDKGSYYLSGNYINNEGIIRGSSFSQYAIRSNLESIVNKKIKVGMNLFLAKTIDHPSSSNGSNPATPNSNNLDAIGSALVFSPTLPVYDANGNYTRPSGYFGPPAYNNPLSLALEPIFDNIGARTEVNSYLSYDILKGLTAKVLFGVRLVDNENSSYINTKPNGGLGDAIASISNSRFFIMQNTNQLNYQRIIAKVHDISLTAVFEQQRELFNQSTAGSRGFSSDVTTYNNLGLGSKPDIPSSTQTRKDIQSFVGRLNYSLMNKYLLSLTSRYDGASVFGTDKWGYFPSIAIGWRVSNEPFMANLSSISNLKLRTSYGITGSQAISPYSSLSMLNTNMPYAINGTTSSVGIGLGTLGNPDLKWEKTAQLNIGLDLGLLDGRIVVNADYYNKETSDLLMTVPLPKTSGYSSILRNIGKVQNRGFEFSLGGDPFKGAFKWNTNFNISVNKNKVLALSGQDEIAIGGPPVPNFGNTFYLKIGEPIGLMKGYIQNGTWGTAEIAEATKYGTIPGAPKYIDQNNDGKIDPLDIVIMGHSLPTLTYGWNNTFSYNNFDLNILIQGSEGNDILNCTRVRSERSSSDSDATDRRILDRWTPEHQNTNVPSFLGSNQYENLQSSRWLENGSYLRVKNITLGYNLSQSFLTRIKISSARIFVSGVNLFTFTKYTGYDPEASTSVGTMGSGGSDAGPYPAQKMYSIGFSIKL